MPLWLARRCPVRAAVQRLWLQRQAAIIGRQMAAAAEATERHGRRCRRRPSVSAIEKLRAGPAGRWRCSSSDSTAAVVLLDVITADKSHDHHQQQPDERDRSQDPGRPTASDSKTTNLD